jgi:hypothetical protein
LSCSQDSESVKTVLTEGAFPEPVLSDIASPLLLLDRPVSKTRRKTANQTKQRLSASCISLFHKDATAISNCFICIIIQVNQEI